MRWTLGIVVTAALVLAAGGCGSTITVPDQGIIVTGCQLPGQCFRTDCACSRDAVATGACTVAPVCSDPTDPSTCNCPANVTGADAAVHVDSQCIETAQACVGRGAFCGGPGARCKPPGTTCDGSGDLPMMIPTVVMMGLPPMLEPHCQFVDDICCSSDGGLATD